MAASAASRRVFLGIAAACGTATAILAAVIAASIPERKVMSKSMRYEEALAALFKRGDASLDLMVLSRLAGFEHRLPEWLSLASQADPRFDGEHLRRLFEALLTADAERIEAALRSAKPRTATVSSDSNRASPEWLDEALERVVRPLVLLGRGDILSALHANSQQRPRRRQEILPHGDRRAGACRGGRLGARPGDSGSCAAHRRRYPDRDVPGVLPVEACLPAPPR
jgi:hypothetical protein